MSKVIYKYTLDYKNAQVIEIPSDSILSAVEQDGQIVVYALVDKNVKPNKFEYIINGTGNPLPSDIDEFTFLNTVNIHGGRLMFHVFYRKLE